jgi:serine/threonine protein phosphatase 1
VNRTIAFGDIHGCLTALEGLLDLIKPTKDDTLVFLGDYIDRGNQSKQVIDKLIELKEKFNVHTLMGNHEELIIHAPEGKDDCTLWCINGGVATIQSYSESQRQYMWLETLEHPKQLHQLIPYEHWKFFKACEDYYETDTHIFLHANYDPDVDAKDQNPEISKWRHFNATPKPHKSGKTVIVGHTPQKDYKIRDDEHVICIDTGACGSGCLTALEVNTKKIWQVDKIGAIIAK